MQNFEETYTPNPMILFRTQGLEVFYGILVFFL